MAGSGICRVIQPTKALSSHSDHVIGYKFVLSPTYDAEKREGEEVEVDGEKRPKQDTPHHFDLDTLKHFYGSHCPLRFMRRYSVSAEAFYEWLTYAHGKDNSIHEDFRKRELSMTLEGDLYIRYQGYSNAVHVK